MYSPRRAFAPGIVLARSQRYFRLWMQLPTTVLFFVSSEGNFSEALTFTKSSARMVVDILTIYFASVVCTYICRFTDAVYVFMAHNWIFFWLQFTSRDLWSTVFMTAVDVLTVHLVTVFIINLTHNSFSCIFISILYTFQTAVCPSSGELIVISTSGIWYGGLDGTHIWYMSFCVDDLLVCRFGWN